MEALDAEKPKTKLASGRIAEIVAELERVVPRSCHTV